MKINRPALVGAFAFFIAIGSALSSASKETVPVHVKVSIEVDSMEQRWGEEKKQRVEFDTQKVILLHLESLFPYWNFQPESNNKRSLKVRVVEVIPRKIEIHLQVYSGSIKKGHWVMGWFSPGDELARKYPTAKTMPNELAKVFELKLMEKHESDLKKWLKSEVPLAKGGEWLDAAETGGDSRIVLALPYEEKTQDLSVSTFHISAKQAGGLSNEKLEVVGLGLTHPYPQSSATKKFDGLVVQAHSRIIGQETRKITNSMAPEVRNLKLGPVYLKKEEHWTGQDVDLFEDDE